MATHWVKSLQCKSNAFDDVHHPKPKKALISSSSCANSSQTLKDVVFLFPKPDPKPKPKRVKPKPNSPSHPPIIPSSFPSLTELPPSHSSRRVVEIIFGSSWASESSNFPGRVEMLFRVHNPHRTVARFEDYRSAIRRARADDVRCAVDGNEMMRFHCAPSLSETSVVVCCAVSSPEEGKNGIRTFAGSGGAQESVGGGPGRRAMLVCRVIAGRVRSGSDPEGAGDSVSGRGKGEIVVFDSRAVLPCFLIIYKI